MRSTRSPAPSRSTRPGGRPPAKGRAKHRHRPRRQLLTTRRDLDGFDYVHERAAVNPTLTLEGVFQTGLAGQTPIFGRISWLEQAIASSIAPSK